MDSAFKCAVPPEPARGVRSASQLPFPAGPEFRGRVQWLKLLAPFPGSVKEVEIDTKTRKANEEV